MEATQSRKYDIWASNALFLTFGLSVLMGFLRHTGYFASDLQTKDYLQLYLITPFLLLIYYYIRKGLRPAKTLFLVLYGLVLINIISYGTQASWFDTGLKTFDFLSQHFLQTLAGLLILLSLLVSKKEKQSVPANK
ncbi:hypothetical protein [Hymenobacter defluvii]|uniref:Uncharacterized protein n=1 Tax=Hymenobacter defluvii TaxID=2054411 RepID=A0ABS3TAQ6_9BACT|nr:hypothetical protein [Hymenobacter defluvii]MBO3270732.1 hypothetical protein [Hymenobacter defluvii]